MKAIFLFSLAFTAFTITVDGQSNFTTNDLKSLKLFECSSVKIDGKHDHYVFVVHDTTYNEFYTFKDTTLASGTSKTNIKSFITGKLLATVRKIPALPAITETRDTTIVGRRLNDL